MTPLEEYKRLLLHRDRLRLQLEHAEKALDQVALELACEFAEPA